MMARKRSKTRTQDCGRAEAKTRLDDARQQLAYAELHGKNSKPSERKASVATGGPGGHSRSGCSVLPRARRAVALR